MIKMLRNTVDKNNVNYQITQWIQNESENYKRQLQNLSDSDLRQLVDYIATDVRKEFQKLEIDKDNLELLKIMIKYFSLNKINWHWEWNENKNLYELELGIKKNTNWVTTEFNSEKENNKNYYLVNPARFVWKSDVAEIALKIVNDQANWFFTNQSVSELVVSQDILNELKVTIVFEFKDIFDVVCELVELQNVSELKRS